MGQLENYIELMFHISIQQHAMNPVKEGSVYTLPYMINWVRRAKFDNENFTPEQVAYMLATVKWETAHTFQPIEERGGYNYFKYLIIENSHIN